LTRAGPVRIHHGSRVEADALGGEPGWGAERPHSSAVATAEAEVNIRPEDGSRIIRA
jgi:hypothetical protein